MGADLTLRQRTRRAVRAEIVDAAMSLFLSQGFEATTIEEIARAAGISRRSYFRYFANKDEALAEALASIGQTIAQALTERPKEEAPWDALRFAFDPLVEQASAQPNAEALAKLMLERPCLQQGKNTAWLAEITAVLAQRLPADEGSLRARALAAAAITCLHTAQEQWLEPGDSRDLGALLTITMSAVHPFAATIISTPAMTDS
ncbi:TetR/AcrR family transcriptional regulator [Amycolatopsis thermophila]|uniref:AcrR family transcriptional regulator n=1 Tax=Amycolatopsis thermophila TaxID=206084 RepID=A0ABU0EMM2_9PSEU|nr:TetR/AcrR family transcriptional regulator [Amycolatopsis thermophila]MDQ0376515.1 AcrR family transcriptional regulator [Amycolatopsis thermophila]